MIANEGWLVLQMGKQGVVGERSEGWLKNNNNKNCSL
jgi:hypothetical protein